MAPQAYAGRVRKDIDHKALKPAAWRVDDYLTLDEDEAADLDDLRGHTLTFTRNGTDAMDRDMDKDDLVVRLRPVDCPALHKVKCVHIIMFDSR